MLADRWQDRCATGTGKRQRTGKQGSKSGGKQQDGSTVYTYPKCATCGKHHKGECLKGRDIQAEIQKLQGLAKLQQRLNTAPGGPTATEKRQAHKASAVVARFESMNEEEASYSLFTRSWTPETPLDDQDIQILASSTVLDVSKGAFIDSATMAGVANSTEYVQAYDGRHYRLTGIRGSSGAARGCTVGFPTVTDSGEPILICTTHCLLAQDANENLLSLAQLLHH